MLKVIQQAYLNTKETFYEHDYVNLTTIHNNHIDFPARTTFLSEAVKKEFKRDVLLKYDDACFISHIDGKYGLVAVLDVSAPVKKHEFIIPDVVTGMVLNYQHYNTEAAPISLLSKNHIEYEDIVKSIQADHIQTYGDDCIYVYTDERAAQVLEYTKDLGDIYVADGHHRLLASQHIRKKDGCLITMGNFDDALIRSIRRSMEPQIPFEDGIQYLAQEGFEKTDGPLEKGVVEIEYQGQKHYYKLDPLMGDVFENHDVYRLHTQIISQGFQQYDSTQMTYHIEPLDKEEMISFNTYPMSMDEFIHYADRGIMLPPKSTAIYPKFPSLLVMRVF